ncbi:MAG: TIGR01777 family oxidoreductase [Chromatocurvus sp.]
MHILLTGGTGFIGEALVPHLRAREHSLTILSRSDHVDSDHCRYIRDLDELTDNEQVDVVINLAGASLAGARWTAAYKRKIIDSRLDTTAHLIACMQRLHTPPSLLLNASAIGFYGHGETPLTEAAGAGEGFSAELCMQWEEAARRAEALGTRVCLCRFGVVLDAGGGAFEELYRPFRFGVANWIGNGRQCLSWVHRADVVAALDFLMEHEAITGPVNITAPEPVTSRDMCAAIKRYKRTLFTAPVPAPVMRVMLGEMANELLIHGQRVSPDRLTRNGFTFTYPTIDSALRAIIAR